MEKKRTRIINFCVVALVLLLICMTGCFTSKVNAKPDYTTPPNTIVTGPSTHPNDPAICMHENVVLTNKVTESCNTDGFTGNYVCKDCGVVIEEGRIIEAHHGNTTLINIKSATCTEAGYTGDVQCTVCGAITTEGITVQPSGHRGAITNATMATCTQSGYTGDEICTKCNEVLTRGETISPVSHQIIVVQAKDATCTEDGYTGDKFCTTCEQNVEYGNFIPATGHKNAVVNQKAATCTENGYSGDTTCTVCNAVTKKGNAIPAKGHKYGEWVVSKEPTGFETGSKYHICVTCKHKETASIPKTELYPIVEEGDGYRITITREWFENAWVYAAHLEFTDYARFGTSCANGKYNNGYETTSHAASRLGAILAVNGCYSAPYLNYTVVRSGKIWNGADKNLFIPAVYSSYNGKLISGWESGGDPTVRGKNVRQLVEDGLVTDTFCFGPPGMTNGVITDTNTGGSRAQRTFIGTNGNAGDIWVCVSDGRYNDGESAGLTGNQCMRFLASKGCTFGVNLDGGGSSTMVYRGHVLNAAKGNERAVVDFVYFK